MTKPRKCPDPTEKPRRIGWNAALEDVFIEALMDVPHIARAAALADISKPQLYRRRKSHPEFVARWDDAVSQGWLRLDAAILARAIEVSERGGAEGETMAAPMTMKEAIHVRNLHAPKKNSGEEGAVSDADGEAALVRLSDMIAAVKRAQAMDGADDALGAAP